MKAICLLLFSLGPFLVATQFTLSRLQCLDDAFLGIDPSRPIYPYLLETLNDNLGFGAFILKRSFRQHRQWSNPLLFGTTYLIPDQVRNLTFDSKVSVQFQVDSDWNMSSKTAFIFVREPQRASDKGSKKSSKN